MKAPRGGQRHGKGPEGPANPLLPLLRRQNVTLVILPLQRPSAPVMCLGEPSAVCRRSYIESTFLRATLCTLERQSLCESHRQRRWLTYWSYVETYSRYRRVHSFLCIVDALTLF